MTIQINGRAIGLDSPPYFIADIAASHDGSLQRAVDLIGLAAEAGADAAKFQNFTAAEIVSDRGFRELGTSLSHQAKWSKSVFEVYEEASIPHEWTPVLKQACDDSGIDYFSAAYDFDAVDMLEAHVPAYKIGSGDIDWLEMLEYTASKGKPILLATGASHIGEVARAVLAIQRHTSEIVLMQCNTNYTASLENFAHIHLKVLQSYSATFPELVLGLSDHTPGHATVLGAIALGARAIEKHFTDDVNRDGPDHAFSMDPKSWREMVEVSRELGQALGSPLKQVAQNETETSIIQRRAVRARRTLNMGHVIQRSDFAVVRPATPGAISASAVEYVIGMKLQRDVESDEAISWGDVSPSSA
jgi:N-acetylneuraminate synthase